MIIAKTIKGKGALPFEDKNGWHGKALDKDMIDKIFQGWGAIATGLRRKQVFSFLLQNFQGCSERSKEP